MTDMPERKPSLYAMLFHICDVTKLIVPMILVTIIK
jgi:hypothetical protein